MSKPKAKKRPRVSLADQVRLGPQVAALKAKTDPKEWSAIVKNAHARGFTVAGATSGVPDALKERTRGSLVEEANRTVGSAFKPAETTLNYQEQKVKALSAKRAQDENHFQEWLANQHETMATRALTADAELNKRQAEIQQQTQQSYTAAQATAHQNAGAAAGNVSNPQQSTALNLAPEAQGANDQVAAQRQRSASMSNTAAGYALASQGVNIALGQQGTAKRISDENAGLADVAKDRAGLMDKRAAAAAEEISRLFGVEINKADSNRNYLAAADKLGIASQQLQLDATKAQSATQLAKSKLKLTADIANQTNATNQFKIANANQQKALDRKLRLRLKQLDPKAKPVTSAQISTSTKAASRLTQIASYLKTTKHKDKRAAAGAKGASKLEYELALDLAVNGKLSPINKKRAAQLGILNPGDF